MVRRHALPIVLASLAALASAALLQTASGQAPDSRGMLWSDCSLYESFGTRARLEPGHGPFDELYTGGAGFQDGVGSISESHPGEPGFNGGRWHVNVLRAGVNPDKYSGTCRVEDLDLSDFEPTDTYFQCPLIPHKSR